MKGILTPSKLAKELGITYQDVLRVLHDAGHIDVEKHNNKLSDEQVECVQLNYGAVAAEREQELKKNMKSFYSIVKIGKLWYPVSIDLDMRDISSKLKKHTDNPKPYKSAAMLEFEKLLDNDIYKEED